jgi:hypothetical protein
MSEGEMLWEGGGQEEGWVEHKEGAAAAAAEDAGMRGRGGGGGGGGGGGALLIDSGGRTEVGAGAGAEAHAANPHLSEAGAECRKPPLSEAPPAAVGSAAAVQIRSATAAAAAPMGGFVDSAAVAAAVRCAGEVAAKLQHLSPLSPESLAQEQQQLLVSLAPGALAREQPEGLVRRVWGRYMQVFRVFEEGFSRWVDQQLLQQQQQQQQQQDVDSVPSIDALQGLCNKLLEVQMQLESWECSWQVSQWLRQECEAAVLQASQTTTTTTITTSSSSSRRRLNEAGSGERAARTMFSSPTPATAAAAVGAVGALSSSKVLNPSIPPEVKTLALHPKAAAAELALACEGLYQVLAPWGGGSGAANLLVSEVPMAPALHWVIGCGLGVEVQRFVVEGRRAVAPEQERVIMKQVSFVL